MKILAVVDFGLTEMSGGYQRNMEVISRMKSLVNLDIVPSLRNVRLAINGHRRELLNLVKGLNSTPGKVLDILEEVNSTEEYEKRLSKIGEDYDVGIVYSNSAENIRLARKITKSPVGVQLQLEPFYEDLTRIFRIKFRGPTGRAIERFRNAIEESNREKEEWMSLIREGVLNFAVSVSKVPLSNSGLDKMIKYDVSYPGNAFDQGLLHLRRDKEDYAVYFTRLIPEKGLFEVPIIWKKVNRRKDIRLYVMGNFQDPRDEEDFLNLVKRMDVNIEYLGFKEGKRLYEVVAGALFTLYPSHYDSFSLVVLESLALNTAVVAYDTQAIREIYQGVKGVHTAKEDDINGLAELALSLGNENIEIPVQYSSWDSVVKAELNSIRKCLPSPLPP